MAFTKPQPLQSLTREQFWHHHITHWQQSDQSKMRYCRENELPYHQLIYWCDKLAKADVAQKTSQSNFVSVSVAPAESRSTSTLSVELPNGINITGVNAETVRVIPQLLRCL